MSGIAGLFHLDGRPDAGLWMESMLAAMDWLGPDDGSLWAREDVSLGRRLRMITEGDAFDRQPLVTPEGDLAMVAAARLDNRRELADRLAIPPAELAGMASSELMLRAYRRWGEGCVHHLRGDYCFAVWEARRQRLVLARDPMGHFPLHYHASRKLFAFASRPAALLALPDIPKDINQGQCRHFLDSSQGGRGSWYAALESLPAGHWMEVSRNGCRLREFWNADQVPEVRFASREEYYEAFRAIWFEAVANRLGSPGKTGVLLSGGLDSAAVAAAAAHLLGGQGRALHAFSFRPLPACKAPLGHRRIGDESKYIEAICQRYPDLRYTYTHAEGTDLFSNLQRHMKQLDAPVQNPNYNWSDKLFQQGAEQGIATMLTGQRGNIGLSFSGEGAYVDMLLSGRWGLMAREIQACMQGGRSFFRLLAGEIATPLRKWSKQFPKRRPGLPALGARASLRQVWNKRRHSHEVWDLLAAGHGMSSFDPCRDQRLVEFCLGAPGWIHRQGRRDRLLVREGLSGYLPSLVLERTDRGDQAYDALWRLTGNIEGFRNELARLEGSPLAAELVDLAELAAWCARLEKGDIDTPGMNAGKLYRNLLLGQFILRHETIHCQ